MFPAIKAIAIKAAALMAAGYISKFSGRYNLLLSGWPRHLAGQVPY